MQGIVAIIVQAIAGAVGGGVAGNIVKVAGMALLPKLISGDQFNWRTAWSAVAAVGLRPCSGALIVLSFAFLNGLWAGGVLSLLATIAVTAKNWAVYFAGDGRMGNRIHKAIEILGAAFVLVVGLLLLSASLTA